MNYNILNDYLDTHLVPYERNISLKKRTWIHRGGIANYFITPISAVELESVVSFLYSNGFKFLLVGHTSNLYIYNDCNIPIVVSTSRCRKYSIINNELHCEAGVGVINLSKNMINQGIKGFEYLTGLPGTVGAAIVNNSSCQSNSISSLLLRAKVVLSNGSVRTFYPEDFKFEFRNSVFKKRELEGTIVSVILKVENQDAQELKRLADENNRNRLSRLEGHSKNLGCTVNRCFINGRMALWLRIILLLNSVFVTPFIKNNIKKCEQRRNLICWISGYATVAPYISPKNPIIFRWLDEGADSVFSQYLDFMKTVYKTDKLEIEIVDTWQE